MSQTNDILRHLAKGKSLTPLEALERFGCLRLAARVNDLRLRGHRIDTDIVQTKGGAKIARYSLCR